MMPADRTRSNCISPNLTPGQAGPPTQQAHGGWRLLWRVFALSACGLLLWGHGRECRDRFPPDSANSNDLPFTQFDHPFHFYYAQTTAEYFSKRGAFWGYDPHFMAGYAKTLIFPTSSTLAELTALAGGRSGFTYRAFVAGTLWLTPIFLSLAAGVAARSWGASVLAMALSVLWIWCGFPSTYTLWGMGPFILAGAASIAAAMLLAQWLDQPTRATLIFGGILAALATIAHPSSPIILAILLLPAYVATARSLTWRRHLIAWTVPAVVIVAWSPWWVPAFVLRETLGTTASGFINENIGGRLRELVEARFPEETALLVAAIGSAGALASLPRARSWSLTAGAVLLFALAYFGSFVAVGWTLQPGRYSQPMYALLIVVIAVAWAHWTRKICERPIQFSTSIAGLVMCIGSAMAVLLVVPKAMSYWHARPIMPLDATLPTEVNELATSLRQHTNSSGRILFEDRGRLDAGPYDPFGGTNPSALMPLLAPGQYIGGPYLYTHLKSNFTQVGDGRFFSRNLRESPIDLAMFQRYAELYNIQWVVLRYMPLFERELMALGVPPARAVEWSAPLSQLASRHPEYFRLIEQFGLLRFYELARSPNWAVQGSARVVADLDRLEISDATADASGQLVLSYHWIRTLRSSAAIRPVYLHDDPVPFIAVDNPPREFAIENRFWK